MVVQPRSCYFPLLQHMHEPEVSINPLRGSLTFSERHTAVPQHVGSIVFPARVYHEPQQVKAVAQCHQYSVSAPQRKAETR